MEDLAPAYDPDINPMNLNLARRLVEDEDFKEGLQQSVEKLAFRESCAKDVVERKKARSEFNQEIWKLSGRNSSLLMPWFYPKYPKRDPFDLKKRPFNMILMFMFAHATVVFRGSRQVGKEQPYSVGVLTPSGWRTMGNLKVGDMVFGRSGKPCQILAVHEQGVVDVYELTFTDGSRTRCGWGHNWLIKRAGCKNWKVETLSQIVGRSGYTPSSDLAIRIPLTQPVEFPEQSHELSPYTIGALLGNGGMTQKGIRFTSSDSETIRRMEQDSSLTFSPVISNGEVPPYNYYLRGIRKGKVSSLQTALRELGMFGKSSLQKSIPESYLRDSVKNRWELLRGLMDTGGSIYGNCSVEYYSSSPDLIRDVAFLVESLGGSARVRKKGSWFKDAEGNRKQGSQAWRIRITRLSQNPFHLKRKADRFYAIKYESTRVLKSVVKLQPELSRCLEVDSQDHTYLTDHCIVTHNSTSMAVDMRLNAHLFSNFKQLYIAPHTNPLETFSRKFVEVERAFRFPVTGSKFKQNMTYKAYPNGSEIDMQRVMTSSVSIRGKSSSAIRLDEAQLFDPGLEMEVLEVLSDSNIKSYVMAGTATTTDTLLETRYQEGCQAVWHIHHPNGKDVINCGDPDAVIPYIGEYQMEDPVSHDAIDPLNGFYQFMNPDGFRERIVSIHVPQIINPDKVNKPLEWNGIYKALKRDRRTAIKEKLGIPLEEGNREVTLADLKNICVIPDGPEERQRKCKTGFYRNIVSAFDWGGADYNTNMKTKVSTTCHAILGVSPDDKIHILHGRRHGGATYHKIMQDIILDHVRYNAGALCSDFGGGPVYHNLLRTDPRIDPTRHIIFDYDDPEAPLCQSPSKSELVNMLMLNKTDSLTHTFMAIVAAEPYLLCPSWDEFGDLLQDFTNNHRVISEKSDKGRRFTYHRHGSKPDDFLHAVNFGMSLIRLHYNQATVVDIAARNMIRNAMNSGGSVGNSWASALSSYAKGTDEFD